MNNYKETLELLGLPDQNLPLFKETRLNRLQSIDKILGLINLSKRLSPQLPKTMFTLDPTDPEWEDKMIYPYMDYQSMIKQCSYWLRLDGRPATIRLGRQFFLRSWWDLLEFARQPIRSSIRCIPLLC